MHTLYIHIFIHIFIHYTFYINIQIYIIYLLLCCSGVSSVITGKISVREVQAVKSRAFQAARDFKSIKNAGWNSNIKRQTGWYLAGG